MGASDVSILPQRTVVIPTTIFRAGAATDVPLVVEGITGQTASIQQWKSGDGTTVAYINGDGSTYWEGPLGTAGRTNIVTSSDYGYVQMRNLSATGVDGSIVGRTYYGATDAAGTTVGVAEHRGYMRSAAVGAVEGYHIFYTTVAGVSRDSVRIGDSFYNAALYVTTANVPARKGLVIRAASGQTANIQEWQNTSGVALTYIDPDGIIRNGGKADFTQTFLFGGS